MSEYHDGPGIAGLHSNRMPVKSLVLLSPQSKGMYIKENAALVEFTNPVNHVTEVLPSE